MNKASSDLTAGEAEQIILIGLDLIGNIIQRRKSDSSLNRFQRYSKAKLDLSTAVLAGHYPGDHHSYEHAMKRFAAAFGV